MILWIATFLIQAWAYIPEYNTIAIRAASQHGSGAYQIIQEVTYKRDSEAYTVKEIWNVVNENHMKVTLEGLNNLRGSASGTILFGSTVKTVMDGRSSQSQRLGDEWLEPLFHFRSSRYLRSRLVSLRVTPSESMRDRPPLNADGPPKYEPVSFIRLGRAGGSVAWTLSLAPGRTPALWIEQDQFVIRKYKSNSDLTLNADDYVKYDKNFWFPRRRVYNFGPYTVEVKTIRVNSLGKLTGREAMFQPSSLRASDSLRIPEVDGLREFYKRFR